MPASLSEPPLEPTGSSLCWAQRLLGSPSTSSPTVAPTLAWPCGQNCPTFQANPIAALADFTAVSGGVTLLPPGGASATGDYAVMFLSEARGQ